jgi:hypothetical protein
MKREYSTADNENRFQVVGHMEEKKLGGCEKVCQKNVIRVAKDVSVMLYNVEEEDDDGYGDGNRR